MCYAAVCGGSCGQKSSLPFAGNGFPAWTGSVFHTSDCLHCNSESRIQQVISAPSMPQKLGGCKQRDEMIFFAWSLAINVCRRFLVWKMSVYPNSGPFPSIRCFFSLRYTKYRSVPFRFRSNGKLPDSIHLFIDQICSFHVVISLNFWILGAKNPKDHG